MASLLKQISECFAVSGIEDEARKIILNNIKSDDAIIDSMGNVIVHKKGTGKKILVSTHMDESGFIITDITDDGYLKFQPAGNIDINTVISKRVVIGENKIKGVIGMKAIHLQTKDERANTVPAKKLFIDIGAKNKKEAQKKINIGDFVTFETEFAEFDNVIKGKALSRIGIATLIESINNNYNADIYYAFTVQKEIGMRGAEIISRRINPDCVINIDTIPSDDMYGVKEKTVKLGEGVYIVKADKYSISDKELSDFAIETAKKSEINYNIAIVKQNISDLGALQTRSNGAKAVTIAVPCRYANTSVEFVDKRDLSAMGELLNQMLTKIGEI